MKFPRENFNQLSHGKSVPYFFEIKKRNQVLFYFGANHSHDPKNKQYPILKRYWAKFLKTSNPFKVAVVEGGLRRLEEDESSAAVRGAEASFVTFLAYNGRIPVVSPEPSEDAIIESLRNNFPEDQVQYHKFASLVDAWRRYNPKPRFEPWMASIMTWQGNHHGFKQFTLPHMKAVHQELFGEPFNNRDQHFFNAVTSPNETTTVVNKVARFSSDLRDDAIVKQLQKEWRAGRSLFVAYGSGHAFIQEEILKKTLK